MIEKCKIQLLDYNYKTFREEKGLMKKYFDKISKAAVDGAKNKE